MLDFSRSDFPDDFTFGVATSAYQIEGHQFGGAGRTHWDDFAQSGGNVVRAENGAIACDHYHRYEEDFDLIANAGLDAYRFSASWARVLPEGRGQINQDGLDFYDRLVDALAARNIKPFLTLYHWELPSALADLGGWRNRDIAAWFADYADILLRRIGDRVSHVAPINEPWCVAWLSHMLGHHAPGLKDIRATARAMHHVLLAHGRAIEAMRALGQKNLGGVFNFEWPDPVGNSPAAKAAAALYDGYYNRFFIEGIFKKAYPENVLEGLALYLPENYEDDFEVIATPLDWCGINYYTRKLIKPTDTVWPSHTDIAGDLPKTQMGWEVYPEGLARLISRVTETTGGKMPIYITENGMANDDAVKDGTIDDQARIDYLNAHLKVVQDAAKQGAPLKGYFVWSLLDNYEWALGYEKRFGIVHVDFETLKRTPKASYHALKAMLGSVK